MSATSNSREKYFKKYIVALIFAWTVLLFFIAVINVSSIHETTKELAATEARAYFNRDKALRLWATSHGGVYVPETPETPPNLYLKHVSEQDILTPSGNKLTLMNPAYLMRQLYESYLTNSETIGHLTSLKLLNPHNGPAEWEKKALQSFEKGETDYLQYVKNNDNFELRLMEPLFVKKGCLKCHAHQGYSEGEVRGGVSIVLSMAPFIDKEVHHIDKDSILYSFLWLLGILGITWGSRWLGVNIQERDQAQKELQKYRDELEILVEERTADLVASNSSLENALKEVKTLQGIIPICSYCKQIRDDRGSWNRLEKYICKHSTAKFSHGICPDCYEKQSEKFIKE